MLSDHPSDDRPAGGYEYGYEYGYGYARHDRFGFGQPATDSELLRQFGRAYDEHVRTTGKLVVPDELRQPRAAGWSLAALASPNERGPVEPV